MTPGQEAMREAARIEAALVYGGVRVVENGPRDVTAVQAEAALDSRARRLERAVRDGLSNAQIMERSGVTYKDVQAARRRVGR